MQNANVREVMVLLKEKSSKKDTELFKELGITKKTYYNIKSGKTTPRSLLFFNQLNKLKRKYKINESLTGGV